MSEQQIDSNEIVFDKSEPISQPETEQAKPETPPVAENAEDTAKADTAEAEAEKPSDKQAEKVFTQEELDAIIQKRLVKLERKLKSELAPPPAPEPKAEPVAKPKIEDYADIADYIEAMTDYKAEEKIQALDQKKANEVSERQYRSEAQRREALQEQLMDNGNDKYQDFDEVAAKTGDFLRSKNLSFSREMLNAMLETNNAHDIVYHLGTDLEEAARIAALSPYAQAKEIGKLEDKLSVKKPPKLSSAPEPATPIHSGKSTAKSYEDMTTDELIADAKKRGASWAR